MTTDLIERLVSALEDCAKRMDRARHILTDGEPTPDCNWGMLDAATARTLLAEACTGLAEPQPIDMVLHCPNCGKQHIDAAEPEPQSAFEAAFNVDHWTNPPHRSHLCHGCGHIWRPADVPTNGVAAVKTRGKEDSPIAEPADSWHSDDARDTMRHPEASDLGMSMFATQLDYWEAKVQALVDEAKAAGFVVRVEQVPLKPLAMGNYASKVNVNAVLKRGASPPRQTFRVSPPGATLIDGVAYGPFPIHGAVIENGAIVCCEEHDREPCPHNPLHRCKACPGNKGMQP